jgi:hypothetical protein
MRSIAYWYYAHFIERYRIEMTLVSFDLTESCRQEYFHSRKKRDALRNPINTRKNSCRRADNLAHDKIRARKIAAHAKKISATFPRASTWIFGPKAIAKSDATYC